MAASRKGGFSKSQANAAIKKMKVALDNYEKALKTLKTDLDTLQNGDGKNAYWSGARAYAWFKEALGNYDHSIVFIDKADDVIISMETLVNAGKNL